MDRKLRLFHILLYEQAQTHSSYRFVTVEPFFIITGTFLYLSKC